MGSMNALSPLLRVLPASTEIYCAGILSPRTLRRNCQFERIESWVGNILRRPRFDSLELGPSSRDDIHCLHYHDEIDFMEYGVWRLSWADRVGCDTRYLA